MTTRVVSATGEVFEVFYPKVDPVTDFTRINVDDGAILLDHAAHNDDTYAHLFLKGTLQSHESFLKIQNSGGTTLLHVDNAGKLYAPQGVVSPETTTVGTNTTAIGVNTVAIAANTAIIDAATSSKTDDTLVLRDNDGGTDFTKLTADILEIETGGAVALYGDANIQWVAQDAQGVNIAGAITRLGRNHEEQKDQSGAGDGVEVIGRPEAAGERNRVQLFAYNGAPSVEVLMNKVPGVPAWRLRDSSNSIRYEIDEYGAAVKLDAPVNLNVVAGVDQNSVLGRGLTVYNLTLQSAWSTGFLVLVVRSNAYVENHMIQQIEVQLDERQASNPISSQIYLVRYEKHLKSQAHNDEVRIIMKHTLLNGETSIPSGTVIRVMVLNTRVL